MSDVPAPAGSLTSRLRVARERAAQLNERMDVLNALFAEVEQALTALDLGVSASVPLDSECELVFGKRDSAWALGIRTPEGWTPPAKASKARRIAACRQMEALENALIDAVEQQLADSENASTELTDAIKRLR
jgi:hypothetical protein